MTMDVDGWVQIVWHIAAIGLGLLLSVLATGHVVLHKRDSRAAIAWVGFVWLLPVVGAVLYFVFGVNRIRHKAALLRRNLERYRAQAAQPECPPEELQRHLPDHGGHLSMLARVVGGIVDRPLLPSNRVDPLVNGEEAFPAMLEAIRHARRTVSFLTYIFDRDEVGMAFARALGEAARRGVEVRVLIDATGTRYSFPTILRTLQQEGVRYARFLPPFALGHLLSMNMRTHRKILVADGRVGFTGGMNIRVGHCLQRHPPRPVQDIHFQVQGPVVTQLQEVFADDWLFTTGEALRGDAWFPKTEIAGQVLARGVTDGPDENFEKFLWTLLGALSIARNSIQIMTPYFLWGFTLIFRCLFIRSLVHCHFHRVGGSVLRRSSLRAPSLWILSVVSVLCLCVFEGECALVRLTARTCCSPTDYVCSFASLARSAPRMLSTPSLCISIRSVFYRIARVLDILTQALDRTARHHGQHRA